MSDSDATLHVLFASESGNGEDLADRVARNAAEAVGVPYRIREMDQITAHDLADMRWAIFIISTTGQGDVPYDAEELWDDLIGTDAPLLDHLNYGVLALGDRVYADFCSAGIELDDRLGELGAHRHAELLTCDDDYERPASKWLGAAVHQFAGEIFVQGTGPTSSYSGAAADSRAPRIPEAPGAGDPDAVVEGLRCLSDSDPDREILHVTLALPEGELRGWEPGDSFDLVRSNDPEVVAAVLDHLGIDPEQRLRVSTADTAHGAAPDAGGVPSAAELLRERLDLRLLPHALFEELAERTGHPPMVRMAAALDDSLGVWKEGRDLLSVLQALPPTSLDLEDLVRLLRPLQARTYSAASSPWVDRSHVDLTVRTVRYEKEGRTLEGTVSGALSRRTAPGSRLPVRLRPAPSFRLSDDPTADVVMIGPGVGVAPFRAFLQHRQARGDTGRSWLFCGIRDRDRDFLYRDEFEDWRNQAVLDELDVATSRSAIGPEYVQHRIARRGRELIRWIQEGATLYVCGDARSMAVAVRLAVRAAATTELGSQSRADSWLAHLDAEHRYLQDVY
jgi:sulfite reductase (NADPH) flavoprotein alpha-component